MFELRARYWKDFGQSKLSIRVLIRCLSAWRQSERVLLYLFNPQPQHQRILILLRRQAVPILMAFRGPYIRLKSLLQVVSHQCYSAPRSLGMIFRQPTYIFIQGREEARLSGI